MLYNILSYSNQYEIMELKLNYIKKLKRLLTLILSNKKLYISIRIIVLETYIIIENFLQLKPPAFPA